jgi:3-hydroxyisobutyrate dehydrogenase
MLGDRGGKMLAGLITPPTSTVTIFVKDASIVVDEAQLLGVPAFMAVTAQQQFIAGVARGWGGHDDSR